MTKRTLVLSFIILTGLTAFCPRFVLAQIPRQISYQGLIVTPGGTPISDGQHTITITLYDAPTGGTQLYTETQNTQTNHGLFNVIIGAVNPIPTSLDFGNQYWLGVSVDGGAEMSPRTALTAVPYALHAQIAEEAKGFASNARGVVTSINEVDGPIRIVGDSTTNIQMNGKVLTISANPSGIQTIQNLDGTIDIIQPKGPTVTIGVADSSISTRKLARGAVTTEKIADNAVTGGKINQMGALTGQVIKWNGTTWVAANDDTTKIKAGTGIVITQDAAGNNVITTTLIGLPPGTLGATLRHDGTNWVANTFLYNDGAHIGIGTTTPQSLFDINNKIQFSNTGVLRFNANAPHYTSFQAGTQTADVQYTLPPSLQPATSLLAGDPGGQLNWVSVLPPGVTVPFSQITSGTNTNQSLAVGNGSSILISGSGIVQANSLRGATIGGNSYAGRVAIPTGATSLTVSLPATVGCTNNSSVTVNQFDSQGSLNLVGAMVTDIAANQFTVQFSASYPTNTGFLTYLVVNP
ncbi:MAG TPA: hypothetical protein VEW28_09020 [Candidatus Kapabacteria bacterium]|nr:hypothetical protein [Candidatus Kapabacteria bacterium]